MFDRSIDRQINESEYEIAEKDKDGYNQKDRESEIRMTGIRFYSTSIMSITKYQMFFQCI